MTLKIRSLSPKSNQVTKNYSFIKVSPNDVYVPVWFKSGNWLRRLSEDRAFSLIFDLCDLENLPPNDVSVPGWSQSSHSEDIVQTVFSVVI